MKNRYVVYIIEPDKDFIITKNWKQKCNFVIEIIKNDVNHGKKGKKENKSLFQYECRTV